MSANAFCGFRVADTVHDHGMLSRFRSDPSAKRAMHRRIAKLNAQLAHRGVWVQQDRTIDAAITPTARKPQGKSTYMLPESQFPL